MDTDVSFVDRALEIRNLFDKVPCPLDIVVYTPEEVAYWREVPSSFVHKIFAEGYVVYDRATEESDRGDAIISKRASSNTLLCKQEA